MLRRSVEDVKKFGSSIIRLRSKYLLKRPVMSLVRKSACWASQGCLGIRTRRTASFIHGITSEALSYPFIALNHYQMIFKIQSQWRNILP
jgi:hypothetical protein